MCDKKQKSTALVFLSLITGIREASEVKFKISDERVMNKGTITARTIERIARETTTTITLEHPTVATLERYAPTKVK